MKIHSKSVGNESGFVLVVSILMLLILIIIGVAALNTSSIGLNIAGNERVHKQTFYQAEAGTELAGRLIEENISCPEGFDPNVDIDLDGTDDATAMIADMTGITDAQALAQNIIVTNLLFAQPDPDDKLPSDTPATELPSPANREAYVPPNSLILPNTNLRVGGIPQANAGSGLAMNAGYIGLGYSAASGGASIQYEVNSQNLGLVNSESIVSIRWRHMIGMEGECNY